MKTPTAVSSPAFRSAALGLSLLATGLTPLVTFAVTDLIPAANPALTQPDADHAAVDVMVSRATDYFGRTVSDSAGQKIGEITDCVFDLQPAAPRLAYVIVRTGGVADMGGELRAVPPRALTVSDKAISLQQVVKEQFLSLPTLSGDRAQFLRDHRADLAHQFNLERDSSTAMTMAGKAAIEAPKSDERELVFYSALNKRPAYSLSGDKIGTINDAWISFDGRRAPYLEINQTFKPFERSDESHLVVPMARLQTTPKDDGYALTVQTDELWKARPVNQTEGVRLLRSGELSSDTILLVSISGVASATRPPAPETIGAGAPTGRMNPPPAAPVTPATTP